MPDSDRILITDMTTSLTSLVDCEFQVVRADFQRRGLFRKTELIDYLPTGYDSYLLLDSDTRVLDDIDLGYIKAEEHGMAMAPAPHYSLDYYGDFGDTMRAEGVELRGQLQYNSGVIFFALREDVKQVFRLWAEYGRKYDDGAHYDDQPFLTLSLEQLKFIPYTLSHGYNYRGFGDIISGVIRIWHSHYTVPSGINSFESAWPPRRVIRETIITPEMDNKLIEDLEASSKKQQ